jgi:hypothetical protein
MTEQSKPGTTLYMRLVHEHSDWSTNSDGYNFPTLTQPDFTLRATKNPDRTISVWLTAPDGDFDFCEPMPSVDELGLRVVVTWAKGEVILYLNEKLSKKRHSPRTRH